MEDDGTEPRPGIIAGQGRRKTAKTGEDGENGTEPRPGIIAGQGRRKTAKTVEDGG